ncbi:MAG: ABC transporter ATP-binding protein [Paludibacteraceae bacterium]|nr:ABC transporter ATP-binding protein [Paludibacteraceae bacterium]HOU67080.1 ABC transporter ATP-binding protein [Paludibacteraceae bacterium]HQF49252.1 ABC transporter ATP-binding protein [Paludibacteraceae bacterium]
MKGECILSAKDLSIGYRTGKKSHIVEERLNFQLNKGELVSLLGPNGAGKSTLLRTLSASQPAINGSIELEGKELCKYSEHERSLKIGIVLTDKTQVGGLTVYELVALGRQPHTGFFGQLHKQDKEIIKKAIEDVGMTHKMNNYMAEISDGERQKTMIAKALVQECPLILLDEPTAFLDVVSRIEIINLLHRIAEEQQKSILLSTHDIEQALILSDRLWLLAPELGLQCGVTEDIILSNKMDKLFNREAISFDSDHGVYYPTIRWEKEIELSATDETLTHWGINALNRNGFKCILSGYENKAATQKVNILAANEIIYQRENESKKLSSFEELIKEIVKQSC